ncbi:MAG: hypothetical protein GY810_08430 [Aureispira sp.]|nr:hypothetical protein [Aureispira sp.]
MKYWCSLWLILFYSSCAYYTGNMRAKRFNRQSSLPSLVNQSNPRQYVAPSSWTTHPILKDWAEKPLGDWKTKGKVHSIRVILAKLALNQDIVEVNRYILDAKPWGKSGTDWAFNPNGDYDFTEILLCAVVFLFDNYPDRLYPITQKHIVNYLLTEEGNKPRLKTRGSLGIVKETENHLLMTEASRYLKHQWLYQCSVFEEGSKVDNEQHNNLRNGMEQWLYDYLEEMEQIGLFEFNSVPYMGYTSVALLVLEAFADSERISTKARRILDLSNWQYALGSQNFRHCPPFRRQLNKVSETSLNKDAHTSLMQTWYHEYKGKTVDQTLVPFNNHQSLVALILPYQLPSELVAWIDSKKAPYFARLGHGWHASPEIYHGSFVHLLSAGGVQRGKASQIVPRPITLLLADGRNVLDYTQSFHISGKANIGNWNNTGVHKNFAVGRQPVSIPEAYKAKATFKGWQVFEHKGSRSFKIAVYNSKNLGLLLLFPNYTKSADYLSKALDLANPDLKILHKQVIFPDSKTVISFDLKAQKNKWVIKSINGKAVDRKYDNWPRITLE